MYPSIYAPEAYSSAQSQIRTSFCTSTSSYAPLVSSPPRSKLDQLPGDELAFGNSVYSVRFDSKREQPLYGHRYWFFLRDAVEDVPEFVVRWEEFKA